MAAGEGQRVERRDADPPGDDLGPGRGRDRVPRSPSGRQRRLDEQRAAVDEPGERVAEPEGRHVVERHEVDPVELRVLADRLIGDGQVVRRRQALLLRAVARVGLDDACRTARRRASRRACWSSPTRSRRSSGRAATTTPGGRRSTAAARARADGGCRGRRSRAARVAVRRPASRRPRRGRRRRRRANPSPAENDRTRGTVTPFGGDVVQRGRDLAGQRVRGGQRLVRPLDDRRPRGRGAGRDASSAAGNGRKLVTATQPTGRPCGAQVVDDGDGGVGDRAHRDEDLGRVVAAIRVDDPDGPAGQLGPFGHAPRPARRGCDPYRRAGRSRPFM